MSMRYVRLKALQRPPCSARAETTSYPTLLGADGISSHIVRPDVERLAQVLGATTKTNQYGEFLSVRCWCAQPTCFSPDLRALKLLLPEAPEQITNPDEWLFLRHRNYRPFGWKRHISISRGHCMVGRWRT